MKHLHYILISLLICSACQEEQLPDYVNQPGLYFYRESGVYSGTDIQRDSLTFSFFAKSVLTDGEYMQFLDICTVGEPEARERKFKLVQANLGAPDAAQPGVHYVAFDDPRMEPYLNIPANAVSHRVPIICINDSSLSDKQVRLKIEIAENENFVQGIEAQSTFVIHYTDMVTRPNMWIDDQNTLSWFYYFGRWSVVKMRYISLNLGFVDYDEEFKNSSTARKLYYSQKMVRLLKEYNDAHSGNPMKDENKNTITFPNR